MAKIVRRYGWKRGLPQIHAFQYFPHRGLTALPSSVDLQSQMPPVYDQQSIGSCTSHASAGLAQFLTRKLKLPDFIPSRLALYYWERLHDGTVNQDAGSSLSEAMNVLVKNGAPHESLWPYNINKFKVKPPSNVVTDGTKHKVSQALSMTQDLLHLKSCLAEGYPFIFGFTVYESFESNAVAKTGIMPMPKRGEQILGGHAVLCYGFNDAKQMFKVRNSWGCYDDQTELLTERGWKPFKDLIINEKVATLNPITQTLEYQSISDKQTYSYNGDLYAYKSQGIDLNVTPNHNLYIKSKANGWHLTKAEDVSISTFRMKKDAAWHGTEQLEIKIGKKLINMDTWLEFLGYFISEGHTHYRQYNRKARLRKRKKTAVLVSGNTRTYEYEAQETSRIENYYITGISQIKKENFDKIQKCLDKLPFKFWKSKVGWTTNNKPLFNELKQFGKSSEKHLPDYVKALSARQLHILYEALMLGDGSVSYGKSGVKRSYYTSSKKLADDFQELLLKIGYAGNISFIDRIGRINTNGVTQYIEYRVGIRHHKLQPRKEGGFHPQLNHYNGNVYCVTVPNHIIYVRRNGKAVWCGNSTWGDHGSFYMPYSFISNSGLADDFWCAHSIK